MNKEIRSLTPPPIPPHPTPPHPLRIPQLDGKDVIDEVLAVRKECGKGFQNTNEGELAAFIAYALAFPRGFLALVDTYDTLESGVPNFLMVSLVLHRMGYKPLGIRLDSGDLAWLSKKARLQFKAFADRFKVPFESCTIVASNSINETVLNALAEQGHEIDSFGIGTNLVTCQAQPALGMVYKVSFCFVLFCFVLFCFVLFCFVS